MRTRNSILNVSMGIVSQIVITLFGFVARHYFVAALGIEILGINATITSIISMLSLTELGIGTAIICNLYTPLAQEDRPKIISLMQLFSKVYKIIAVSILILGLAIAPFLKWLLLSKGTSLDYITSSFLFTVYTLFLADTVISYFLSYKRSILNADQKSYIITLIHTLIYAVMSLLQIIILLLTKNFILYLILKIAFGFLENITIAIIANKKYPYINSKEKYKVESEIKNNIIKNTKALALHYIGIYLINGTDMLIITRFLGVAVSGIYSNYLLIITVLRGMLNQFSSGITSSFGNMLASKDKDSLDIAFYKVFFISFILANFSAVSLFCLFNPFISLWMNRQSLLGWDVILVIVINFYIAVISEPLGSVRSSAGLFRPDRYLHIFLAALNLIIAIILVQKIGIIGVFLGTSVCLILKEITVLPLIVYKNIFHKNLWGYYKRLLKYFTVTALSVCAAWIICTFVTFAHPWVSFIIKVFTCAVIPNTLVIMLFYKTEEYRSLYSLLLKILKINKDT